MATRVHANNYRTTLNGAINNSVTSLIVTSATGLPSLGSNYCYLTLTDGTNYEIVKVTNIASTTLTIVRAQEGSTAQSWANGIEVSLRSTADSHDRKLDSPSGSTNQVIKYSGGAWTHSTETYAVPGTAGNVMVSDGTNWTSAALSTVTGAPALTLLSTKDAAGGVTSLDFTSIVSGYSYVQFVLVDIAPATSTQSLWMLTSSDNSTYDNSSGNYAWVYRGRNISGTNTDTQSASDTKMVITDPIANSSAGYVNGSVFLMNPAGTVADHQVKTQLTIQASGSPNFTAIDGMGVRLATTAVQAVRFMFASGNIASGKIYMYGLKNA